jgi:hypothetical protein
VLAVLTGVAVGTTGWSVLVLGCPRGVPRATAIYTHVLGDFMNTALRKALTPAFERPQRWPW